MLFGLTQKDNLANQSDSQSWDFQLGNTKRLIQAGVSPFLAGNENGKDDDKVITTYTKEESNQGWTQVAAANRRREYVHHNQHMKNAVDPGARRDRIQRPLFWAYRWKASHRTENSEINTQL